MITPATNPKKVQVGHWHIEHPLWERGVLVKPWLKEVRFDNPEKDYTGLLHGFLTEGTSDEGLSACALVEKSDGTFDTPSVTIIKLI